MGAQKIITIVLAGVIGVCLMLLMQANQELIMHRLFGDTGETPAEMAARAQQELDTYASRYGTEITLTAASDGHFYLDATVDRSNITFLIDTARVT